MDKLLEDIRTFFTDFEVSIKDLQHPSHIFVRDFYIRALLELDVDDENVRKIQFTQSDVDQEEVEIIPELNLVVAAKAAFPFIDIGLFDLLIPNEKRTCQHIRNIMNFLTFADSEVANLNPHLAIYQSIKDKIDAFQRRKDAYSEESNELALQKNDLMGMKDELLDCSNEMEKKLQLSRQEYDELSSKKKVIDEMLEKKNMITVTLKQEQEMLERQIGELKNELVENPEIDHINLKERENHLAKLNAKQEEAKTILKEKKNIKLKLKENLEMINEKLLPTCSLIVEENKKYRGHQQEVINKEKELKRLIAARERLTNKKVVLEDELIQKDRRKIKLLEEWHQAEAEIKKSIAEKESKYSEELTTFKATKKWKKKFEDSNKVIEDTINKVVESKKMFDDSNCLLERKEKELEEFVSNLTDELEVKADTMLKLKKEFDNFKNFKES